eukprot:TRINITY_DN13434_c0_g1_i1.p1 TRINITY_DN13434_c0_g1~~TRINITY_DN13434_c0_g1_i1.p1  ORF type:complete len:226 (+),score=36.67 TRINITY_DN13434_c0_g1_i1:46-723(+)
MCQETADVAVADLEEPPCIWNFAYGANMNRHKLEVVRKIVPRESVAGRLDGYRLAFTHRGAMGNVEQMAGQCVHGVLHKMTPVQFASLASTESEYLQREVQVEAYDGRGLVPAVIFYTPLEGCIAYGLPPPARYLKLLQVGAASWNLDERYVQWLHAMPSIDARDRSVEYWVTVDGRRIPGRWGGPKGGRQSGRGRGRQPAFHTGQGTNRPSRRRPDMNSSDSTP